MYKRTERLVHQSTGSHRLFPSFIPCSPNSSSSLPSRPLPSRPLSLHSPPRAPQPPPLPPPPVPPLPRPLPPLPLSKFTPTVTQGSAWMSKPTRWPMVHRFRCELLTLLLDPLLTHLGIPHQVTTAMAPQPKTGSSTGMTPRSNLLALITAWTRVPVSAHVYESVFSRTHKLPCTAPANNVAMKIWTCYAGLASQAWYYTADNRIAVTGQGA
jgi:hypothetical protein